MTTEAETGEGQPQPRTPATVPWASEGVRPGLRTASPQLRDGRLLSLKPAGCHHSLQQSRGHYKA